MKVRITIEINATVEEIAFIKKEIQSLVKRHGKKASIRLPVVAKQTKLNLPNYLGW